jgi:predicted GNAT superfamily acetyltransferase
MRSRHARSSSQPGGRRPGGERRDPGGLPALREEDPELSRSWRDATADAFEACLRAGMEAVGFERFSSSYIFAPTGERGG